MKVLFRAAIAVALVSISPVASAQTVVVLRGGTRIELKSPPVRKGKTLLLTRTDGTVLSVPAGELDARATSAAQAAAAPPAPTAAPPPATLSEAARAARAIPKARVRITDADVAHGEAAPEPEKTATAGEPRTDPGAAGAGRVEVADYTQTRSEAGVFVQGTLRNPGATPAINVRMSVTALDPQGQIIAAGEAGLSNGLIDAGATVSFSVTIPVGQRSIGSFRFSPRWVSPSLPAAAPATSSTPPAASTPPPSSGAPPAPAP